ncbi:MAG: histidine phosphatase family protein [Mycobacterium sp.]|nr:histidine phosphatase family protein [Mycobacterium sp.]
MHVTTRLRHTLVAAAIALAAFCLLMITALPSWAMTVTFIRHGESEANAGNSIDTSIPGPGLTTDGQTQAAAVADKLQNDDFVDRYGAIDAIFASTMVRTQQTAEPLSDATGMPITVLGGTDYINDNPGTRIGVQEITSGIFTGLPEKDGLGRIGYIVAPLLWTMGLQFVSVPGGESGLEFNERMTNALNVVEETTPAGDDDSQNAAVFSHGATIMMWTMMNVDNPDLLLLMQHPLSNTDVVVVTGSNEQGWHLESWAGQEVADANYPTQMFVNFRDLIVAPQTALYNMRKPVLNLDAGTIVSTAGEGIADVGKAAVKFVKNSVNDTIGAITGIPNSLSSVSGTSTVAQLSADTTEKTATVSPSTNLKAALTEATEQGENTVTTLRTKATERAAARAQTRKEIQTNVRELGAKVTSAVEKAGQDLGKTLNVKPKAKAA